MIQCRECGWTAEFITNISFCPSCGGENISDLDD